MKKRQQKQVFVGMSGGVDSSVSATLLKQAGYDVTGVFIKVWQADFLPCTWREERLDAMRVCAQLGIPFLTFDFEREYKQEVVDYMIAEYRAGRTPNPDVMCNRHIKFGAFWREAKRRGADFIATGHYARIGQIARVEDSQEKKRAGSSGTPVSHFQILSSTDTEKDQTYFLWTLVQKDLAHTLFPIGALKKPQVRALAENFGLPTAEKKDSQGLCFIGHVDMKDFLKHYLKPHTGAVLDESGARIGTHDGAYFYTLGQRHGFTLSSQTKTSANTPLYIVAKDVEKNTLTVSPRKFLGNGRKGKKDGQKNGTLFVLDQAVWNGEIPHEGRQYAARIRYRQPLQKCHIRFGDRITVVFEESQGAVASGQSLVLYSTDGKECLGGGVIQEYNAGVSRG